MLKIKKEYLDYVYIGAFFILVFSFITGTLIANIGYSMVVIDNSDPNSMWPTYFQGDLFVLKDADPSDIVVGDVIVYEDFRDGKIIHRVIDKLIVEGAHYFRVKGDNPETNYAPDDNPDTTLIHENSVLGKIVYRIPYLGHLSLAMQRNTTVQIFIYFAAILFGIAIVFWPDDDEEEKDENGKKKKKDEFIEITANDIKIAAKGIISSPLVIFRNVKASKHRKIYLGFTAVIVILLVIPTIAPNYLNTGNTPSGIGILGVDIDYTASYQEKVDNVNYNYDYMELEVELYDNAGIWKKITGFTVKVFTIENNPDSLISMTKWNSLRDFKGSVIVGGSIVVHENDRQANGSPIYVQIKLNSVEYLIEKSRTSNYELSYNTS